MSKLAGAPLQEVITEIRWSFETDQDRNAYQFLTGDLYNKVSNRFPYREVVIPTGFPIELLLGRPALRFRVKDKGYPLIQLGPGLLTINTIGDEYDWDTHSQDIKFVLSNFFSVSSFEQKQVAVTLAYIDFFEFDFENSNVFEYLSQHLHTQVNLNFINSKKSPRIFNLTVGYSEEVGTINVNVARGKNPLGNDGIAIQTNVIMEALTFEQEEIEKKLNAAHTWCSDVFKKMTEGLLYESFHTKD